MNVACNACPAKYAVPDEKVRGKRARITCKHCGNGIIIDGTSLPPIAATSPAAASEPPPAPSEQPTAERGGANGAAALRAPSSQRPGEGPWLVAITDERQESASIARIVELFASGTIDGDTYLWREGMSDWKTPFEIPQIEAALRSRSFFPNSPAAPPDDEATQIVPPPSSGRPERSLPRSREDDEGVTVALDASRGRPSHVPMGAASRSAAPSQSSGPARPAPPSESQRPRPRTITRLGMGSPPPSSEPPQRASTAPSSSGREHHNGSTALRGPSGRPLPELHHQGLVQEAQVNRAARRAHGRGTSGTQDLFADRQAAELLDEAPTEVYADDALSPRMTGARNESSVLFSLDAISKAEQQPERPRRPSVNAAELMYGTPPPPPPFVPPHARAHAHAPAYANPFAAPDFTAPPRPEPPPPVAPPVVAQARHDINYAALVADDFSFEPPRRRGRKFLIALLLLGGAAGAAFALGLPQKYLAQSNAPAPQEPPVLAPRTPPVPKETAAPAAAEPTPEPSTEAAAATTEAPARAPAPSEPALPVARATRSAPASARPSHPTETIEEPQADAPRSSSLAEAIAGESRKSETKSKEETSDAPKHEVEEITDEAPAFDRGAAVTALGSAASSAQSCKMIGGPTGSGQATVTFARSGRVTSASVSGDFAGSSVGSCVAKLFRSARVPAFSGDAVTVTKRFSIE